MNNNEPGHFSWEENDTIISPYGTPYIVVAAWDNQGKNWVRMINKNDCQTTGDQPTYEEIGFVRKSDEAIESNEC